jgi:hypothetical protein
MNKAAVMVGGMGVGAALMYAFDPVDGRRRRALARDQLVHLKRKSDDAIGVTARDMRHRAQGLVAEARALFQNDEVPDDVLVERVRAKLGLYVSHPGAVEVVARDACVTLRGSVLASEVQGVLRGLRRVRGMRALSNELTAHSQPTDVPALQGGVERSGEAWELLQRNWSPTARVFASVAGASLIGAAGRQALGPVLKLVGAALVVRALTNVELSRVLEGAGARRGA